MKITRKMQSKKSKQAFGAYSLPAASFSIQNSPTFSTRERHRLKVKGRRVKPNFSSKFQSFGSNSDPDLYLMLRTKGQDPDLGP